MQPPMKHARNSLAPLFYLGMIVVTVVAYLGIRAAGSGLEALPRATVIEAARAGGRESLLASVMLALAVIMVTARLLGFVCHRWLGQPPVIGEIVAGILLGPSFLGLVAPGVYAAFLPTDALPFIALISKLGVTLFM